MKTKGELLFILFLIKQSKELKNKDEKNKKEASEFLALPRVGKSEYEIYEDYVDYENYVSSGENNEFKLVYENDPETTYIIIDDEQAKVPVLANDDEATINSTTAAYVDTETAKLDLTEKIVTTTTGKTTTTTTTTTKPKKKKKNGKSIKRPVFDKISNYWSKIKNNRAEEAKFKKKMKEKLPLEPPASEEEEQSIMLFADDKIGDLVEFKRKEAETRAWIKDIIQRSECPTKFNTTGGFIVKMERNGFSVKHKDNIRHVKFDHNDKFNRRIQQLIMKYEKDGVIDKAVCDGKIIEAAKGIYEETTTTEFSETVTSGDEKTVVKKIAELLYSIEQCQQHCPESRFSEFDFQPG